jgi:hypothetical protein
MPDNERVLFDTILTDSLVHQDHRAPAGGRDLAVAIFKMMGEAAADPLPAGVHAHPAGRPRHMASACCPADIVREASDAERRDGGLHLPRAREGPDRLLPLEAYCDIGFSRAQIDEVGRLPAARNDYAVYGHTSSATCTPRW